MAQKAERIKKAFLQLSNSVLFLLCFLELWILKPGSETSFWFYPVLSVSKLYSWNFDLDKHLNELILENNCWFLPFLSCLTVIIGHWSSSFIIIITYQITGIFAHSVVLYTSYFYSFIKVKTIFWKKWLSSFNKLSIWNPITVLWQFVHAQPREWHN